VRDIFLLLVLLAGCAQVSPTAPVPSATGAGVTLSPTRDLVLNGEWSIVAEAVNRGRHDMYVALDEQSFVRELATTMVSVNRELDFRTDFIVFLNPIVAVDCPDLVLSSIHFDASQRLLYGVYETVPDEKECTDVAGSHLFVVKVARSALPAGTLTFRVMKDFQLCPDCGRESEQVTFVANV
jgi:hypothetical protein